LKFESISEAWTTVTDASGLRTLCQIEALLNIELASENIIGRVRTTGRYSFSPKKSFRILNICKERLATKSQAELVV